LIKIPINLEKLIAGDKSENILLLRILDLIDESPRMEKVANTSEYKRMTGVIEGLALAEREVLDWKEQHIKQ
jgi:hypothetical protein